MVYLTVILKNWVTVLLGTLSLFGVKNQVAYVPLMTICPRFRPTQGIQLDAKKLIIIKILMYIGHVKPSPSNIVDKYMCILAPKAMNTMHNLYQIIANITIFGFLAITLKMFSLIYFHISIYFRKKIIIRFHAQKLIIF